MCCANGKHLGNVTAHLVALDDCAGRLKKTSETTTSVAEAVPAHFTKRRKPHHFASTPRMRSMNKSSSERLRKARTPSSSDSFRQCAADRDGHLTFSGTFIQNAVSRWHAKGKPCCGINRTIVTTDVLPREAVWSSSERSLPQPFTCGVMEGSGT